MIWSQPLSEVDPSAVSPLYFKGTSPSEPNYEHIYLSPYGRVDRDRIEAHAQDSGQAWDCDISKDRGTGYTCTA